MKYWRLNYNGKSNSKQTSSDVMEILIFPTHLIHGNIVLCKRELFGNDTSIPKMGWLAELKT